MGSQWVRGKSSGRIFCRSEHVCRMSWPTIRSGRRHQQSQLFESGQKRCCLPPKLSSRDKFCCIQSARRCCQGRCKRSYRHGPLPEMPRQQLYGSRFGTELYWLSQIDYPFNKCPRSEEQTSELQSPCNLVCRLLL